MYVGIIFQFLLKSFLLIMNTSNFGLRFPFHNFNPSHIQIKEQETICHWKRRSGFNIFKVHSIFERIFSVHRGKNIILTSNGYVKWFSWIVNVGRKRARGGKISSHSWENVLAADLCMDVNTEKLVVFRLGSMSNS